MRGRYQAVRQRSVDLAAPLQVEDTVVQTMPDVSPTKWHLAHTTWFFETFVLDRFSPSYTPVCPDYRVLFNSYYVGVGPRFERARRGTLSRPTLDEISSYRAQVDARVLERIGALEGEALQLALTTLELGLHHERQHQELMVTDFKHVLATNPLACRYRAPAPPPPRSAVSEAFSLVEGGLVSVGHRGNGFAFDNERPRHRVFLRDFALARDLVTSAAFIEFIEDGGYERAELWLSDGWDWVRGEGVHAPLYWGREDGVWREATLYGRRPVDGDAPVTHVSYYEADAYARWRGLRLPTEHEWEHAVTGAFDALAPGTLLEADQLHPVGRTAEAGGHVPRDLIGEVWEWTSSAYLPYPGYRCPEGAVGEYNGKFMSNQMVLRGGSIATASDHIRPSYRNFFGPDKRWQFTGIRLARDVEAS